jgi:ribose transport system substrate-binding protein
MNRRKLLVTAWLVSLAAMALVAIGCGSDSKSSSTAASTAASAPSSPAWLTDAKASAAKSTAVPAKIPSTSLGTFTPKSSGTIYHVACNLALEGCSKIANAIKSGTQALGYKFEQCDGGTTADKIGACFTNAINAKPDAIVVNGIGADAAADSFAKVAAAKIPLVGSFTGDKVPTKNVTTEIGGDSCTLGAQHLADWIVADSKGKANVLFVGTKTYACNIQREAGFTSQLQKCTSCKVKSLPFAIDAVQSQLPQQLQSAIQSNPGVTYIVGTFDAVALAATDAIRQAGKADSIKVAGFDGDAPNLALIAKGDIQVADDTTGSQEPGWAAADASARAMTGAQLPPSIPLTDVVIDKTNAAQIGVYKGATDFQTQFQQLWGK